MGAKLEFQSIFPLFVLSCEPCKRHPVTDVKIIDSETKFAITESWGDLFLQAFTDHNRANGFLNLVQNKGLYNIDLCLQPDSLRRLVLMLRDYQSLKVGIVLDACTPEKRRRFTHSDLLRLT